MAIRCVCPFHILLIRRACGGKVIMIDLVLFRRWNELDLDIIENDIDVVVNGTEGRLVAMFCSDSHSLSSVTNT